MLCSVVAARAPCMAALSSRRRRAAPRCWPRPVHRRGTAERSGASMLPAVVGRFPHAAVPRCRLDACAMFAAMPAAMPAALLAASDCRAAAPLLSAMMPRRCRWLVQCPRPPSRWRQRRWPRCRVHCPPGLHGLRPPPFVTVSETLPEPDKLENGRDVNKAFGEPSVTSCSSVKTWWSSFCSDHPSVRPRICGCHVQRPTQAQGPPRVPPWPARAFELRNGRNARRQALDERAGGPADRISPSNFYRE